MSREDHLNSLMQDVLQYQTNMMRSRCKFLYAFDDQDETQAFSHSLEVNKISTKAIHIFNNVEACCDHVIEDVSTNPDDHIYIFVRIGLAEEIISCLYPCRQLQKIYIMTKLPPSDAQRETFKLYDKVSKYSCRKSCNNFL